MNSPDTIIYGIDSSYEPYEFVDEDGNAAGFNVELIRAISAELGKEVVILPDSWKNTRKALEQTGIVNVAAYFKSAERGSVVSFSQPISLVYYSIFSRSDKIPIEDLFTLAGKRVAIQEYTIVDDYFLQLAFLDTANIKRYSSEFEAIEAVIAGEADCAITSYMSTNYKMNLSDIDEIQSSSDPVFISEYSFVVNKKDSALLDSLNWGLRLVKASGEYDRIYQKWLLPEKSWWVQYKQYFILSLALILAGLALVLSYILMLKRQVRKKTLRIKQEVESRRGKEKELGESEFLRRKVESFSSVMIIEQNLNHKIIKAPKLFHSLLEYSDGELIDTTITELMEADFASSDLKLKTALLNCEFNFLDSEIEFITKSQRKVWMECSTSILFNDNRKPIGFLQFMLDVTPLKQSNLSLKDMNAELANFMYKTSHDVRGPIANILGLASIGKMTATNNDILQYFTLVEQSTQKLEHIFNDFKEVSFILNNEIRITTFDLKELICELLESIFFNKGKDIKMAKVKVQINLPSNFISTDKALLKKLIFHLVENAFEHNSYYDTSFTITVSKKSDQFYQLLFEDDGVGIPEEIHDKVFDVFFKGKRMDVNIGMGLYISKKVMNRLGGELKLRNSLPNQGTVIEALLPVKQLGPLIYN
ncbi:hypothetical protein GCM10011506_15840 [Marivirga lumbricoides]|uniref:histidine kinase n=1 Tax=Marivirga lumbricoides TaxID=1046115 RepID=A0ABQ1M1F9_9BACT|nr:hypothetical protein GCM10011506_15840 [Marivirga lumbricoides]